MDLLTAERIANELAGGRRPQPTATGWLTWCPAHDDHDPSLSVGQSDQGQVLVHCFSGCSQEAVIDALKAKNLWPSKNGDRAPAAGGYQNKKIEAVYQYKNEAGILLFEVVRERLQDGKKKFSQRRPGPNGNYIRGLTAGQYQQFSGRGDFYLVGRKGPNEMATQYYFDACRRVLYRLPELLSADPADPVFSPEGEKDVLKLIALGLVATCNPGGAGNWPRQKGFSKPLSGRSVVILPDNDQAGRNHALDVAGKIHGLAASIKIVELPGLPDKGDVSDWLASGGTREQLLALVDATQAWIPAEPPAQASRAQEEGKATVSSFSLSDLGNARRLVAQHGRDLHYCFLSKKWYIWTGKNWAIDATGEVIRRAKATVATIYKEAAEEFDEERRKKIAGFALKSEHDGRLKGMISLAQSEPGIPITPAELNLNPWLINCENGTIDLKTGTIRPHNREDLIAQLAPVTYDPTATCPLWERFLDRIFGGNNELIRYVRRALGYSLTGVCNEQVMFICHGGGGNGKTVLITTSQGMMGDYALETPADTLMIKSKQEVSNDIARLDGPRFVSANETDEGRRLNESLIKTLTGQDRVSARFLFREYFDFQPRFKLWLRTNHRPVIRGTDFAIWRRLRLIPFKIQIPPSEQDETLGDKLRAEWSGILNWMLLGCIEWQKEGLGVPHEVAAATNNYREDMDILADFLKENCLIAPGFSAKANALYRAYTEWAENSGERRPLSQRAFSMSLAERGFEKERNNRGIVWFGIGLKSGCSE